MRVRIGMGLVLIGLVATACSRAGASPNVHSTSPSPTSTATHRVIVRPVTNTGAPADGYRVVDETNQSVDCGPTPAASPATVTANVLWCSPTALYAIACWPSQSSTVLCLDDAAQRELTRFAASEVRPVATPGSPVPLGLVLTDGTYCKLRDGGAWSQLNQHPDWIGWYSCTGGGAVWAPPGSPGVNAAHDRWTVAVAAESGAGAARTVAVATAYFVGTAPTRP